MIFSVMIFSEMTLGHVEFLNVKEIVVFVSVEILSWYHADAQNIRKN